MTSIEATGMALDQKSIGTMVTAFAKAAQPEEAQFLRRCHGESGRGRRLWQWKTIGKSSENGGIMVIKRDSMGLYGISPSGND